MPTMRRDAAIRAFYEDAMRHSEAKLPLIDVRSPGEFRGEVTHMPEYPQEGVLAWRSRARCSERALEGGGQ